MTKKDYELIASAFNQEIKIWGSHFQTGEPLKDNEAYKRIRGTVITLGGKLKEDNPKFNEYKFYKACGLYGVK